MIADCETCDRKQVPCSSCQASQRAVCYACQGDVADPYGEDVEPETERLIERAMQVQRVLPLIGPLLDRWEHMSNDVKGSLRTDDDYFYELMETFKDAWMQP